MAAVPAVEARAQAHVTAGKSVDLSAFGGVEIVNPEYGPDNNFGAMLGANFTQYIRHLPVAPSLEFRANWNTGNYTNEYSYLLGARAVYPGHLIEPYVNFLVGPGDVKYPLSTTYTHDNSIVYDAGGGVDVGFIGNVSIKLDLQYQRWNTDTYRFTPVLGSIGVTYHFPFHSDVGYRTRQ